MKFQVTLKNGNIKIITADDLDHAESIANSKWKNWEEIKNMNYVHNFKEEK